MSEDTFGVQGKEPFIFPHYLDVNVIVLAIWYKQLCFHKDQKHVSKSCLSDHVVISYIVTFGFWF